jgi:hypothetical protein
MRRQSTGIVVVTLLATALALVVKQFPSWGLTEAPVAWWGVLLLVPVYVLGTGAMRARQNGRSRRAVHLLQAALFCGVVMIATFFPVLWRYIYIPFIVIVALHFFLLSRVRGE